ncbi:MAG: hypothetical protein Q4P14_05935, partial [Methanobacteriaceae archaeon]|nr:hypothetical protein [Methanobacteriaceae archaeon]
CGCAKEHVWEGNYANVAPETNIAKDRVGLDFVEMHNSIIDQMSEEYLPFFFIKKDGFDISGSNEDPKKIIITADCLNGTKQQDVDLFLSYVLLAIGANASEQDFRYKKPTEVEDGDVEGTFITYADFGTVFNDYALVLKVTIEGKEYMYNMEIKAGQPIPISSKYWKE